MKVFVYGTLKKGGSNHHVMENAQGKLISMAILRNKELRFVGNGAFPAVTLGKGLGNGLVYGEVYEVSPKNIYMIDRLEGYRKDNPKDSFYVRKETTAYLPNGKPMQVHYYLWNNQMPLGQTIVNGIFQVNGGGF